MKKLALLALVPLALALTGCAVPPLDFTPADIEFSTEKVEAELRSVNVSYAKKEEQTGEIYVGVTPQTSEGDNFISAFKDALQSGIDQAGLFRDGAPMKVTVFAKIRKFESPHMSVGFGTTSEVEYTI
ncbi:MAG: hypothetical protein Q4F91_13255, partial [Sutterella sp.]|nr:hypothetical protein [Sutterella sp.]